MAENNEHKNEEHFSKVVRAGKRTYFFDVKSTRKGEQYLTITESKRKFNNEQGKFFYEKFKIFLYKEDFEKFTDALEESLKHIVAHNDKLSENHDGKEAVYELKTKSDPASEPEDDSLNSSAHTDLDFEDLGKESEKVQQNNTNY